MPLPRVIVGEQATEKFTAVVLSKTVADFRSAVLQRHGTLYDRMGHEINRALQAHTLTLRMEARSQAPVEVDLNSPDDPFMNCLLGTSLEGDSSLDSEPEPRVL
jgi:hypothetical protein